MSNSVDSEFLQSADPDTVFSLVADQTRFELLRALMDAEGPVRFSDLRERVGIADSGRFNYHLNQLIDRFVLDADEGYTLTPAGRRLVGGVISGIYTTTFEDKRLEIDDGSCMRCGNSLEVVFESSFVTVSCQSCPLDVTQQPIPPAIFENQPLERAPEIIDRWIKQHIYETTLGFCLNCKSHLENTIKPVAEYPEETLLTEEGVEAYVHHRCTACGTEFSGTVPIWILLHPAVSKFHYNHGINIRETPLWSLEWLDIGLSRIEQTDPLEVVVPIELDDETLSVTVDDSGTVIGERVE